MQNTQPGHTRNTRQGGFTLIELLIVVAIIGILASVGVPQYQRYVERSEFAADFSELNSYRTLVDAELASRNTGDAAAVTTEIGIDENDTIALTTFDISPEEGGNQAVLTSDHFTYTRVDNQWTCTQSSDEATNAEDSQLPQACRDEPADP